MEPLLNLTVSGQIQPCLAETYEWGSDLKSITLHLRKGVKFHDGTVFDAKAVKWNWDMRVAAHQVGTSEVTSLDIIDDNTVKFNLKSFSNAWIDNLCSVGQSNTTLMISPTAYEKNGKAAADWLPVGTGPFKFKKFEQDQYLELERNDDYWGSKPYLDGVKGIFIPDRVTAQLAMEAGNGDYIWTMGGQKDVAEVLIPKGFKGIPGFGLAYNLGLPGARSTSPFAKLEVRQAVEYAIDKEKIVKGIYGDYAQAMYQNCKPEQIVYDPAVNDAGRKYDVAKAKALLKAAGYPNGFATTLYCQQMIYAKDIDAVQAYLKLAGIDAKLEVITVGKWIDMETNGWDDGIMVCPAGAETYRAYLDRNWVEPTEPNWNHGLWWHTVLRPAGLQALLDQYWKINDVATEQTKGKEIERLLYNNAVMIPLWNLKGITMATPKVHMPDPGWLWISGGMAGLPIEKEWMSK